MPHNVRYGDGDLRIHYHVLMIKKMDLLEMRTLDDLFEATVENGWFPVNRGVSALQC